VAPPPNTDVNEFVTSLEQAAQQAIARFPDGGAKPAQHNAAI